MPVVGLGHEGSDWEDAVQKYTQRLLNASKQPGTIPAELTGEAALLPLLASVGCQTSGQVSILDFGGGMGASYLYLTRGLANDCSVDYHVVEMPNMCAAGSRLFQNNPHIHFHSAIPAELPALDIVYFSTVLQYIEDYRGLLNRLCDYQPAYFLFVRFHGGDVPTYAAAQKNLKGTVVAHWFINMGELVSIMAENGYALIFKAASEREYNQDNYPPTHRIKHPGHLLFARRGKA